MLHLGLIFITFSVLHLQLIFITIMVGITFSDVITFSGDTDVVLELPM